MGEFKRGVRSFDGAISSETDEEVDCCNEFTYLSPLFPDELYECFHAGGFAGM